MNNEENGAFCPQAAPEPSTQAPCPAPATAEPPQLDFEAAMEQALAPAQPETPALPAQAPQNPPNAQAFLPQADAFVPDFGAVGDAAPPPIDPAWAHAQLDGQLAQISALDGSIRSFQDLAAMPQSPMLEQLVASGCDLVTAFCAVRGTEIAQQQARVARQQAINQLRSTQHMAPAGGGAAPSDGLTDEVIQQYRTFHPNWSRGKIARYHARFSQR